jgi:hypothetical protein
VIDPRKDEAKENQIGSPQKGGQQIGDPTHWCVRREELVASAPRKDASQWESNL